MPAVKDKAKAEGDATTEAPAKKKLDVKSPKFLVILVVLIAGGYFGYSKFAAPAAPTKPAAPKAGEVVKMDKQIVNLADGHLLQIEADIQLAEGKTLPTTSEKLPQTSQAEETVINTYSNATLANLAKAGTREALKQQLVTALQKDYGKDVIFGVFISVFTTQ
ncbi:MAG: flagellar basal body-associated FliL family protein [Jatrophihabitans sp.]|uniref:flagellar basal body-associated FliL family protein n=1 Tax=Jatrophihabitans sp. TaxID=1932789 RepID=UPI003F80A0CE